jgi:hypothetical protein
MSFVRSALVAAVVLGAVTPGVVLAQTTTPPSSTSSKVDDVSKWTSKQMTKATTRIRIPTLYRRPSAMPAEALIIAN